MADMQRLPIDRRAGWRGLVGPAALAVALAAPAAHAAGSCDGSAPPEVTLAPTFAAPVIDLSLDLAALSATARDSGSQHRGPSLLLGLTTSRLVSSFEDELEYGSAPGVPGRSFCGAARQVRLRLGFDDLVVHIAREVIGDRCLYNEVYQHESRHVAVDRALLAEYAPRVAVGMDAAAKAIGVVYGASPDAVSQAIHQRIESAFEAAFSGLEQELQRRQALVDQPAEYRRMGEVCGGAAARLVGASRRPPG